MDGTASPFLAACRGEPHDRVPVWFMRQAGRSLPEYRALRGEGSILEAIRDPELSAEITMQPVRRYGVDAAILYSDIVVPVAAIGFGVDVAPGTGPVVERPFSSAADLDRLRTLEPEVDTPYVLETVRILTGELPVPLIAFAGRAVHGGQLPRRGSTVSHLRQDQGAHARRPGALRAAARPAGAPRRRVDRVAGPRRRPCLPALRLVGRRPHAVAVRDERPASLAHGVRAPARARRAGHPLRGEHRRAARPDGRRGRGCRRRRLAHAAVGRPPAGGPGDARSRATSTRRSASGRGTRWPPRCAPC